MYRLASNPGVWLKKLTIDGPSASGKSSVSVQIAAALGGVPMLTGKHYRSVTHALMSLGVDMTSQRAITVAARGMRMELDDNGVIVIDGTTYDDSTIENKAVEANVSTVANDDDVRELLIMLQKGFVARVASPSRPVVIEGRDAGTVIARDAELRYFLSASAEARAQRRTNQRGDAQAEATKVAIERRDAADRGHGRADEHTPGLIVIPTDTMTQAAVVARILADVVKA